MFGILIKHVYYFQLFLTDFCAISRSDYNRALRFIDKSDALLCLSSRSKYFICIQTRSINLQSWKTANRQPDPTCAKPLDAPHFLPTRRTPLTARGRPLVQNENFYSKISLLILVSKPKRNTTSLRKYFVFIRKESYHYAYSLCINVRRKVLYG